MSTARQALDMALVDLAARGERPRCAWPDVGHWWTSDDPEDRARAARRCSGCPAFTECGAAAEEMKESFGVWAGVDRSPQRQTKNRRGKSA